jgi:hypothetical protein
MGGEDREMPRSSKMKRTCHPFPGRLLVIGGQCRKVGKSALVVDLIEAFPKYRWTAIKITPHVDSGCPLKGPACKCGPDEHTFQIRYEKTRTRKTDTSRFLAAGAKGAIWVQTKSGRLSDALGPLVSAVGDAENVIIESNAILAHWKSDLFLLVVDPAKADFKSSARKVGRFVDGFVLRSPYARSSSPKRTMIPISGRPKFLQPLGRPLPGRFQEFVRQRFLQFCHPKPGQKGRIFS